MPTTSDYLTQLEQDREDLVDNLETKGITGLTGDETFTELVPEVLNIPSGGSGLDWSAIGYSEQPQIIDDGYNHAVEIKNNWDATASLKNRFLNDYDLIFMPLVDTSLGDNTTSMFSNCISLIYMPLLNTSNVTNMYGMFDGCYSLKSIPLFDTSKATTLRNMFRNCYILETIPILNTSSINTTNGLQQIFLNCRCLSNGSLDNILQMCVNATLYQGTKTLSNMGFSSSYQPASTIQSLPHYQDFIDAGWSIGYS